MHLGKLYLLPHCVIFFTLLEGVNFIIRCKYTIFYGIDRDKIILDPGLGFGKNAEQNIEILSRLNELKDMGPILLGASKKRFIGKLLNDLPFDERVEGTVATTVIGIEKGVDIVRVHNVLENKRACLVADGIYRKRG